MVINTHDQRQREEERFIWPICPLDRSWSWRDVRVETEGENTGTLLTGSCSAAFLISYRPIDLQSDGGISLNEVPSSKVTLTVVKLRKTSNNMLFCLF